MDAGTALMAVDATSAVSASIDANESLADLHSKLELCTPIWS